MSSKYRCIGVLAAMPEEVAAITDGLHASEPITRVLFGTSFTIASFLGTEVVIALSGVGKVNAAATAMIMITQFNPDVILNVGVAGGFATTQQLLDLVVAKSVIYTDVDVTALGYAPGQLMDGPSVFSSSSELVNVVKQLEKDGKLAHSVHYGTIGSGDQFVHRGNIDKINHIRSTFPDVICVEMEGAAIGHVCSKQEIPALFIRCLSDIPLIDVNSGTTFLATLQEASRLAAELALMVIMKITEKI
jgi:adenosylhomocysteine nucleosidase